MAELKIDNGIPVPQWYDQELDDWVFYTNEYMKELLSKIESLQEELEGIKSAQTDGSQKVQVSGRIEDIAANRPSADGVDVGTVYWAVDTGDVSVSTGTEWRSLGVA